MPAARTQCKVLNVGNYQNPSFAPFAEVCCAIRGVVKLVMHSGDAIFELSFIFTYTHPFVPILTRCFCTFLVVGRWMMRTPARFVWPPFVSSAKSKLGQCRQVSFQLFG